MRPFAAVLLVVLAACLDRPVADEPVDEPDDGTDPTFPKGIVWRDPTSNRIAALDGGAFGDGVPPGGFDVRDDVLVFAADDTLVLQDAVGSERSVRVAGIHAIARPSLSPDGGRVAVQALAAGSAGGEDENLDIWIVDVGDATARRVSSRPVNEESPEWSPAGDRIAYSSFDPEAGIGLHIIDLAGDELRTIPDAGGIHLAWSRDGSRILESGRLRIYDADEGTLVADLRQAALDGLAEEGYEPDSRFEGQAGRGTFPLDGAFSPDGASVVFDGAVMGDGHRVVVATLGTDGSGFEIVAGPVAVDPEETNGLNYSELNPAWR